MHLRDTPEAASPPRGVPRLPASLRRRGENQAADRQEMRWREGAGGLAAASPAADQPHHDHQGLARPPAPALRSSCCPNWAAYRGWPCCACDRVSYGLSWPCGPPSSLQTSVPRVFVVRWGGRQAAERTG